MALTLGNWLILGITFMIIVGLILFCIYIFEYDNKLRDISIGVGITLVIHILIALGISWYNTHTASGIRNYKDFQSELSNGLDREIIITAEDGREIFYYEGKVDIESNHEDNYIKFEGEDGRRYMIYYGIQDTIQIIEKYKE